MKFIKTNFIKMIVSKSDNIFLIWHSSMWNNFIYILHVYSALLVLCINASQIWELATLSIGIYIIYKIPIIYILGNHTRRSSYTDELSIIHARRLQTRVGFFSCRRKLGNVEEKTSDVSVARQSKAFGLM